jgi:hypothetical protein
MARRFLSITNFAEMFASAENCKSLHLSTCAESAPWGQSGARPREVAMEESCASGELSLSLPS